MLARSIAITTMAFAIASAMPQASSNPEPSSLPSYGGGVGSVAEYTFLPPTLEPFIHVEFLANLPTNTSTVLGLVGRAPNEGGNVTGAITGTIVPLGAAYEVLPEGADGDRAIYENRWSINASTIAEGNDDGTATVIMKAQAFVRYANAAVFAQGSITFEGRPETDLSYDSFVGQVTSDFNTGVGYLDVFKVIPGERVDGEPIAALLPPGEA